MTHAALSALVASLPARFASPETVAELRRPIVPWRLRNVSETESVVMPLHFTIGEIVALRELARDKGFSDPNGTIVDVLLNTAESRLRKKGRKMLLRAYHAYIFPFPGLDPEE